MNIDTSVAMIIVFILSTADLMNLGIKENRARSLALELILWSFGVGIWIQLDSLESVKMEEKS